MLRDGAAIGIPTWIDVFTGRPGKLQDTFSIGFVGRNLEVAYVLLRAGGAEGRADWQRLGREEAYLALHEETRDPRWLDAARVAADFCETWIVGWDIPMHAADAPRHAFFDPDAWPAGLALITLGFSAVDTYLARHVGEFARLARLTGDDHYRDVARLLLHNTKQMVQADGEYGYVAPGFQIEHWSIGRGRGYGLNSGWLPWVATSHILGIWAAEEELLGITTLVLRALDRSPLALDRSTAVDRPLCRPSGEILSSWLIHGTAGESRHAAVSRFVRIRSCVVALFHVRKVLRVGKGARSGAFFTRGPFSDMGTLALWHLRSLAQL